MFFHLLNREIVKVDVRTALDFRKLNGPTMKLYDVRLDACLLMGSFHKNRFLNLYSKNFKKQSNMQCPLKAVRTTFDQKTIIKQ